MKHLWDRAKSSPLSNGIGYPEPQPLALPLPETCGTPPSPRRSALRAGWARPSATWTPGARNVLTGVNFGRGLPPRHGLQRRCPSPRSSNLETYGLMPDIQDEKSRQYALEAFSRIYGPTESKDIVAQVLSETGSNALKGADRLRSAPEVYSSTVEYADTPISQSLRNMAQVMSADLGTRIYYTMHGSFDTHSNELPAHHKLWTDVSTAIADFTSDLDEHGMLDDTLILVFSEFGRRIKDNGTGTDHGSGGVAFVLGGSVNGGLYGEYPSLRPEDHSEGDMHFTTDFRSTYATILNRWLELDPIPIVHGDYEQFAFL